MLRYILTAVALCFLIHVSAQSFEGKIVYQLHFISKIPTYSDHQLSEMMGSEQQYFIKDANYKSIATGSLLQWQIYVSKENRLYTKMSNAAAALWIDGDTNKDEVIEATINKGVTDIIGYRCDELILLCKSGIQKYYFNSALKVDPKAFTRHKFGNWYEQLSRTKSLPLKMIIENSQMTATYTAVEVKPMALETSFFKIPHGIETAKSFY